MEGSSIGIEGGRGLDKFRVEPDPPKAVRLKVDRLEADLFIPNAPEPLLE